MGDCSYDIVRKPLSIQGLKPSGFPRREVMNAIYLKKHDQLFVERFIKAVDEFAVICRIITTSFESPDDDVDPIKEWIPTMLTQIEWLNTQLGRTRE